jgi:hypothetical protein
MTDETKDRPVFILRLRALPRVDPIRALRHILKRALRDYGIHRRGKVAC